MFITRIVTAMGVAISIAACESAKPDAVWKSREYTFFPDRIKQGRFEAIAVSGTEIRSDYQSPHDSGNAVTKTWKLSKPIDSFPQYQSADLIANAIYNLSLEEMQRAIEPDSTFRTGQEWAGVWTRDISYSIILSMAYLQPEVARKSLLRKVNAAKRIIQDTGTGGAWPVSSDRAIWISAAWELYLANGDTTWLREAYEIARNSVEDDIKTIYDPETGLVSGESSFLDWREQTYPAWMQPADIFESECLGTNAVHYGANITLSRMAQLLNDTTATLNFRSNAERIRHAVNDRLWLPDWKRYGQFLYGRTHKIVSPRVEALGEALSILMGIADEEKSRMIIANGPFTSFGINCIYPNIPGIPPYHNDAVWPFVQAFWTLAAARAGNETAVMESISAIYRATGLFLTNKENFVASDGDYSGTQINSSNMLWSLSGNISLVHKVLFGIHFETGGLTFRPFIPRALEGIRTLTNFKYRNAILNIEVEGYGDSVKSFIINGKESPVALVPASAEGSHVIRIRMNDQFAKPSGILKADSLFSPATPQLKPGIDHLNWDPVEGATTYKIIRNGEFAQQQKGRRIEIDATGFAVYQVIAVSAHGIESFASEPLERTGPVNLRIIEAEGRVKIPAPANAGYTGKGYLEISLTRNIQVTFPVHVDTAGTYYVDIRYANGNGPVNTENKCAIRSLLVNHVNQGVFVFPQRGMNNWSAWGYSNCLKVRLNKGLNQLQLILLPENQNMNGEINTALLDHIRLRHP